MTNQRRPKVATDLPTPPALTDDTYREIERQGRLARETYLAETASMERLGPEDLQVRAR